MENLSVEGCLFSEQEMGGISLEDVFEAYFDCRRRKRNTIHSLSFEADYERKCIDLWRDINNGTYRPSRSIAFIVMKPVLREVFAADFRDRVVHHLIARRIEPLFEQQFITDSYSTRKGKGTLYGIKRVEQFIRDCSQGYTRDCYVMKVDIRSFFMKIPKQRLYDKVSDFLKEHYEKSDLKILLYLIHETIFNRPEKCCVRRTAGEMWRRLPKDKSLFHTDGSYGLPIGNLTSQLLALFYLDELDHKVLGEWGMTYYGRYVDDLVLVHESKAHLLEVGKRIGQWLEENGLQLHPRKLYLQHYAKGLPFVGGMLKPGRKYVTNRTVGFCYEVLERWNRKIHDNPQQALDEAESFVSTLNSYWGLMKHFSTYRIRFKIMRQIAPEWWRWVYVSGPARKVVLKSRYKPVHVYMRKK